MTTLERYKLYRSHKNLGFLYRVVALGPKRVMLDSVHLDGTTPCGGKIRFAMKRSKAEALLYDPA